jgi:hypothetical protein
MCERLKQAVLKTALRETVTGVRIPLPPPANFYYSVIYELDANYPQFGGLSRVRSAQLEPEAAREAVVQTIGLAHRNEARCLGEGTWAASPRVCETGQAPVSGRIFSCSRNVSWLFWSIASGRRKIPCILFDAEAA